MQASTLIHVFAISLGFRSFDHTGVISVCNNKYGNELACIVSDISDDRTSLNIGDSVCIKRIVSASLSYFPTTVTTGGNTD